MKINLILISLLVGNIYASSKFPVYWDIKSCGPAGDDANWGICGERDFNCPDKVKTNKCQSGMATRTMLKGNGESGSYKDHRGCNYYYYAEYTCENAPACVESFTDKPSEWCNCGTSNEVCSADEYCYEGACHTEAKCPVREHSSTFYGAKLLGEWNASNKHMNVHMTVPKEVTIQQIKWKKAQDDSILAYTSADHGSWTVDTTTDPCTKSYGLNIDQNVFFGPGSRFTIDNTQKMKTYLRVDAKENISVKKGNRDYTYDRNIHNDVAVIVQLQKVKNINVHIHMVAQPRPPTTTCAPGDTTCPKPIIEDREFVFFVNADESVDEDSGDMTIAITMKVYSLHCIATESSDKGVRIHDGAEYVNTDKLNDFEWTSVKQKEESTENEQDNDYNFCVEELVWSFAPAVVQDDTYEIDLEFTERGTADTFVARLDIDIKEEDVLTNLGFSENVGVYSDQECTNESNKFALGSKFFVKIELEDLVVDATSIECTKLTLTQGDDEPTDMKSDPAYNFYQSATVDNTVICGAELDSFHFDIKADPGVLTDVDIEITVTYAQGEQEDVNQRRILQNLFRTLGGSEDVYDFEETEVGDSFRPPDKKDVVTKFEIVPALNQASLNAESEKDFSTSLKTVVFIGIAGAIVVLAFKYITRRKGEYTPLLDEEL